MKKLTLPLAFLSFVFASCETQECVKCYEIRNEGSVNQVVTELESRCGCEIHEFQEFNGYEGDIKVRRYCED